jgi:hypothetical protein
MVQKKKSPAKRKAVAATRELAAQFPLEQALQIAQDETNSTTADAQTTLEDAGLQTADDRDLYAIRVVNRVKSAGSKIKKSNIPQSADTKIIEVARAIVSFAS